MRRFRPLAAFTLFDLMIVVLFIGILAPPPIPTLLPYTTLFRSSEAKTNLSGIFTAEKAFFGEYNTYGTDLVSVNWQPDGTPLYVYGFNATYPTGSVAGLTTYLGSQNNTANANVIAPGGTGSARYNTIKMK